MPRFSMPESWTAIFAATIEPAPARSVYRLDMSDSTPILISFPVICACAVPTTNAPAIASASTLRFIAFIDTPPLGKRSLSLHPQVLVQLAHVPVELRIRNHIDDPAMLHHVMPVGDGGSEAEVLLDQQDREALLLQRADRAADLLHDDRRKTLRRLVEQQQARAGAQDAPDREHLLLAAGQFRALALPALGEVREQRVDLLHRQPAIADLRRQQQVLLDVEARE